MTARCAEASSLHRISSSARLRLRVLASLAFNSCFADISILSVQVPQALPPQVRPHARVFRRLLFTSRDNHQVQSAQNSLDKGIQEGSRQSESLASLFIPSSCTSQGCAFMRNVWRRSLRWTPHSTLKRSAIALSSALPQYAFFDALVPLYQPLIIAHFRYDRNHLAVTLRGIQKVTETRHKREADYHTLRMTKHVRFAALACFRAFGFSSRCEKFCVLDFVFFSQNARFLARRVRSSLRKLKRTLTSFRCGLPRCCLC